MSNVGLEYASGYCRTGFQLAQRLLCSVAFAGLLIVPAAAETLPEALVRAYQSSPQLNADRARQRGALRASAFEGMAARGYKIALPREEFFRPP